MTIYKYLSYYGDGYAQLNLFPIINYLEGGGFAYVSYLLEKRNGLLSRAFRDFSRSFRNEF